MTFFFLQGGFVPQGNTVMMAAAQQNVTMVPGGHQGQPQQQQGVAMQHQYMTTAQGGANVAVNVMQIQQQPQNFPPHLQGGATVVQGTQMATVTFSVPPQSQQIQFPAAPTQNHMNSTSVAAPGVYNSNSTAALQYNPASQQTQQRLTMKPSVRSNGPLSVSYAQAQEHAHCGSGPFTSGNNAQTVKNNNSAQAQEQQVVPAAHAHCAKQTVSDNSQESKTTVTMTTVSSRQQTGGVSTAMATTTVTCPSSGGGSVANSNNTTNPQTDQSGVLIVVSTGSEASPSPPGEQGASNSTTKQSHSNNKSNQPPNTCASQPSSTQTRTTSSTPSSTTTGTTQGQSQGSNTNSVSCSLSQSSSCSVVVQSQTNRSPNQSQLQSKKATAPQQRTSNNVAQNYPSLAATLNMTPASSLASGCGMMTHVPAGMTSSVVTTQASTSAQCAASTSYGMTVLSHHHAGHPHPGPGPGGPIPAPNEQGTQRLHHLPVQHYPNQQQQQQQQHCGPPPPPPPPPHQRPPTPHHHLQSPPCSAGGPPHPQLHPQRPTNPHHPHHHMQSPPAMSPHHHLQSPHHMSHHQGALPPPPPHMMHHHHHQGSPPGHHPGVPPGHHPGMYHQGMVPFGPHHRPAAHHGGGGGPPHHPHPHPHPHLQHPAQHPAQYPQHHHPAAGGGAGGGGHPHPHTPSPHLVPSPAGGGGGGSSLRHQHPTLAQSLGHHHPEQQHPPHPHPHPHHPSQQQQQHPAGVHGLRSPPPRIPSPHYNHTHPLTHLNQPDQGADPTTRYPAMNNPHMCSVNMQHGGGPPPHCAMLNQTNSPMHRPPSLPGRHGGQRPHASEFMDPNARLKAMEEESESCTDPQTGCATVTGPQQAVGEGPPDGEEQEDVPGGRGELRRAGRLEAPHTHRQYPRPSRLEASRRGRCRRLLQVRVHSHQTHELQSER